MKKMMSNFLIAFLSLVNTFVFSIIFEAPTDVALAFWLGHPSLGLVIQSLLNPKFFNTLAVAPIFSPS